MNQLIWVGGLVAVLMAALVFFAIRMKSGSDDLRRSSLGSFRESNANGFFGGRGKDLLTTIPSYSLIGFLFTFSLVAWSYMTNN